MALESEDFGEENGRPVESAPARCKRVAVATRGKKHYVGFLSWRVAQKKTGHVGGRSWLLTKSKVFQAGGQCIDVVAV